METNLSRWLTMFGKNPYIKDMSADELWKEFWLLVGEYNGEYDLVNEITARLRAYDAALAWAEGGIGYSNTADLIQVMQKAREGK